MDIKYMYIETISRNNENTNNYNIMFYKNVLFPVPFRYIYIYKTCLFIET